MRLVDVVSLVRAVLEFVHLVRGQISHGLRGGGCLFERVRFILFRGGSEHHGDEHELEQERGRGARAPRGSEHDLGAPRVIGARLGDINHDRGEPAPVVEDQEPRGVDGGDEMEPSVPPHDVKLHELLRGTAFAAGPDRHFLPLRLDALEAPGGPGDDPPRERRERRAGL